MGIEGKKALVADDDPAILRLVAYYLGGMGLAVSVASNGREALDSFRADEPDIVILDVMMPGMSGWEVCRAIRETSAIPVLMISARRDEKDVRRSRECGADVHLSKPLPLKELTTQVQGLLDSARA
ncbi:MAG: response regulator [Anaerolineae bacterium]|nr:response regulator [Anaerolineae bacterium]